jgi:hypothetical protein
MDFADAQRDMRHGYHAGAPGLLVSGLVWLAAGLVAQGGWPDRARWTLLLGGTLIFPASVLLTKALGRPGRHARGNPLGTLAMEGTAMLVLGMPVALAVSLARPEWFFPAMLLAIGGRYLTFATLYGLRRYWACGGLLVLAAFGVAVTRAPLAAGAFAGAAVELAFAPWLLAAGRRERGPG